MHIELARFGTELKDGAIAERDHFPELDRLLRSDSKSLTAVLDLSGVGFVGYAYARQTVIPCLQALLRRHYPVRWIVLRSDREDYARALEGLAAGPDRAPVDGDAPGRTTPHALRASRSPATL